MSSKLESNLCAKFRSVEFDANFGSSNFGRLGAMGESTDDGAHHPYHPQARPGRRVCEYIYN
jgi:hypothetical protein